VFFRKKSRRSCLNRESKDGLARQTFAFYGSFCGILLGSSPFALQLSSLVVGKEGLSLLFCSAGSI
jgi:hypothetical protein